jgi:hypothetical protein
MVLLYQGNGFFKKGFPAARAGDAGGLAPFIGKEIAPKPWNLRRIDAVKLI